MTLSSQFSDCCVHLCRKFIVEQLVLLLCIPETRSESQLGGLRWIGDVFTGSYSILATWRDYFYQLLNVDGVHDVRQTEIHTAEHLVPEPSAFEVELAVEKLKSHKSPGIDQIPADLIKEGGRTIRYQIHKLIVSIWNKEELSEEWKESIIVPIHKKGLKQIVVIIGAYHFCQLRTN